MDRNESFATSILQEVDISGKEFGHSQDGVRSIDEACWISIDLVRENPFQPRKTFSEKALCALADSIRERGVLQPIRVRAMEEGFQVIAGERRLRACKLAGLQEVPAIVCDQSDEDAYIDSIIENLQRVDLNAMERADALDIVRVNLGSPSWAEVGRRVGIGRRQIMHLIGLRALPESIQQDIRDGLLTEKHGRALKMLLTEPELMDLLLKKILTEKLPGDEALEMGRTIKSKNRGVREVKLIRKSALKMMNALSVIDFSTCNSGDLVEIRCIVQSLVEKTEQTIRSRLPLPY